MCKSPAIAPITEAELKNAISAAENRRRDVQASVERCNAAVKSIAERKNTVVREIDAFFAKFTDDRLKARCAKLKTQAEAITARKTQILEQQLRDLHNIIENINKQCAELQASFANGHTNRSYSRPSAKSRARSTSCLSNRAPMPRSCFCRSARGCSLTTTTRLASTRAFSPSCFTKTKTKTRTKKKTHRKRRKRARKSTSSTSRVSGRLRDHRGKVLD